ncbi:MAG: polymer-forming cytoskeletal protein [Natronospirillum sp.]|uniref:bactofilin family protein n=1 Tax=Natronospirillum sp. TaxID=2812955 RepID=UPI0025D35C5C|nr:polymer-forming cytoskeletal protein [Natronospirillum sp.]MCH8553469.1 polymer-forming cytoskeletal protein [Natronospirillum sp.]
MFGSDKKVGNFDTTLISAKAEVVGDIKLTGGLHIDGQVTGNILAEPGSSAVVRVSDKGVVKGEIRAPHVIINGRVSGDVTSFEHVELAKKAEVNGDVYYATMEMVMGARVNGKLHHQQENKGAGKRKLGLLGGEQKAAGAKSDSEEPAIATSDDVVTATDKDSISESPAATGTQGANAPVKFKN